MEKVDINKCYEIAKTASISGALAPLSLKMGWIIEEACQQVLWGRYNLCDVQVRYGVTDEAIMQVAKLIYDRGFEPWQLTAYAFMATMPSCKKAWEKRVE
jgi:hypothetical protein